MDLLWTDSDGLEANDGPARVEAPEQKSEETVAHGVWPQSPNPREHPPVDQVIRSPGAGHGHPPESLGRVESCLLRGLSNTHSEQQYMGVSGPPRPALNEALSRIQTASSAIEVWKICRTLAVAFGAIRPEAGTIKALHAVLIQLLRPGMSDVEASGSTGASKSNFLQWKRKVVYVAHQSPGELTLVSH